MSRRLRAELRLWRGRQHAAWLKHGQPFPDWIFASVTGSALDESNILKAFNRILDVAGLPCRGPHQMRLTSASLLLHEGAPITASITLRVYAHWVPDVTTVKAVNLLDDAQPSATTLRIGGMERRAKWFRQSGDPNVRQLEPDRGLASAD
jgi:integrase